MRGSAARRRWFCEKFEALCLHFQIGFNIAVRRHWFGVAEPKGDDLQSNASLKQAHSARMAKRVAGDPALIERGTMHCGLTNR